MPLIDYDKYQKIMCGGRSCRDFVHDAQLWNMNRAQFDEWLKARERELLREVSAGAGTEQWQPFRARAALELLQAAEFWRDQFSRRASAGRPTG